MDAFEDPKPNDWMLFDESELFVGKSAGLLQHRVTHTNLSDVVKQCTDAHTLHIFIVQIHRNGEGA